MYRLFTGTASISGVRDGFRNTKGFEGAEGTLERGIPGFMPDAAEGREVPVSSVNAELMRILEPYGLVPGDLPSEVAAAIKDRGAFTFVEACGPVTLGPLIDADDIVSRVVRHDHSALAIQQLRLYAIHNTMLAGGKPLHLPPVDAYPGLEGPFVCEILKCFACRTGV